MNTRCRPLVAIAVMGVCAVACAPTPPELHALAGTAQGTTYSLQWSGGSADPTAIATAVEQELARIDALLSNYRPDSVVERFNAARTLEPQALPPEVVALLQLAKTVHAASAGCFDPTVRAVVRAWGFDTDEPAIPMAEDLEHAIANIGFDKLVIVDAEHVRKTIPGLEIDMGSIGQGYTAERLASVLEERGVRDYLAEIGGEVVAHGTKPDGTRWRVGVENPASIDGPAPRLLLPDDRRVAVVTSGTYRHFFDANGRRFSHIIDARTGHPIDHSLLAVTVLAHSGPLAAAWGTALLCLGPEAAAEAVKRERLAALWWVRTDGDGAELRESPVLADEEWRGVLE